MPVSSFSASYIRVPSKKSMSATKNVKRLTLAISPLARSPNMIHPSSAGAGELRPNVSSLFPGSRSQTPTLRDSNRLWPDLNLGLHGENGGSPAKSRASAASLRTRGSVSLSPCPIENDDAVDDEELNVSEKQTAPAASWIRNVTVISLSVVWLLFTVILMTQPVAETVVHLVAIPEHRTKSFWITELPTKNLLLVTLDGSFLPPFVNATPSTKHVTLWLELIEVSTTSLFIPNFSTAVREPGVVSAKNISDAWSVPLTLDEVIDSTPQVRKEHIFSVYPNTTWPLSRFLLRIQMSASLNRTLAVALSTNIYPIDPSTGLLYAALVLFGMYFLIIFELVHRTLAAMLASTMSVAILATFHERPSMPELISWIDIETLLLLFSMMILVAILSETGVFDYLAVIAYKMTSGRVWPLIFTASLSSVLDNVTTVLLMTPVTIRLCEVLNLDPVPILISMIVYSNIGGTLTPVGDPPNAIIASNPDIIKSGVDFGTFTLHMGIGVLVVGVVTFLQLRYIHYRHITDPNKKEPRDVQELRHEIAIWQRTASAMSSYTKNEVVVRETLLKKERRLTSELKQRIRSGSITANSFKANLEEMQAKYPIRNKRLLWKSGITMAFVILFFFLHSVPGIHLSLGWTALLGAIFLLLITNNEDMEGVMGRVEWTTLLFFAALFVLMECLSRLGLIDWIGAQTEAIILSVSEGNRLAVSLMLILWVSAIASAFIDNIPLTTMMIRIVTSLSKKPELGLPLQPLVWALAFGACLGGNGTLIGSSANVVGTGVAEQHGYKVTFIEFFKVGFPLMVVSVCVISAYLLLAHVALTWH